MDEYLIPCLSLLSVSSIMGANACRTISFRVRTTAIEFVYLLFDQGISNPLLFVYRIIRLSSDSQSLFPCSYWTNAAILLVSALSYYKLITCSLVVALSLVAQYILSLGSVNEDLYTCLNSGTFPSL